MLLKRDYMHRLPGVFGKMKILFARSEMKAEILYF